MATQKGVLQALWGEVRPAVEARRPDLSAPLSRQVNRGRAAEAILQWSEALKEPPAGEAEALMRLALRHGVEFCGAGARGRDEARRILWEEARLRPIPQVLNCRLLLDDPLPDRLWLFRSGAWVLYRFTGDRFSGTPLAQVRLLADERGGDPLDLLLKVRVGGTLFPNPKLPPLP